ncbi:MAG: endonuclease/exonuclease/phosphatase family protein [Bacteriovorax sp.]|nr:endonuclease/exonuclease/phosphatase family protein [Bacteriovorax sp.]
MLVKILSYNIHKGFDWKNKNYFLKEMKEFIRTSNADIVFLQEVVGKNNKYQEEGIIDSQFEFLADQLWPHFSYGRNAVYDHGHHGNLILSKYPIESFENIDLSTNDWEKRGLLLCKVVLPSSNDKPNNYFYAACSHLNLLHSGRSLQYQKIKEHIQLHTNNSKTAIILAGDFNDWNKQSDLIFEDNLGMTEVHKAIHGNHAKTFPAVYPLFCLDRIYVKNFTIKSSIVLKPKKNKNIFTHLSDHLPLYCEVEIDGA